MKSNRKPVKRSITINYWDCGVDSLLHLHKTKKDAEKCIKEVDWIIKKYNLSLERSADLIGYKSKLYQIIEERKQTAKLYKDNGIPYVIIANELGTTVQKIVEYLGPEE